jgi:DNA end-binding protein Ku
MATRAYWSGRLRLALVSIPVEIVPATKTVNRISFNQIHEPSGKRIRYEKVVPGIGPVEADEIVKGYEVEKGKYVLLTDDEINNVKLEAKKSVDLVQFVDEGAVDPIYFERPFFVLPDEEDEDAMEAYIVLREALKNSKKMALGQIVVRGQGSIVAIKPSGKGLVMETLRYADEVKKPDSAFDNIPARKVDTDLVELAEELIEKRSSDFQPEKFKDTYTVALRELIEAKLEKRAPKEIEETPPASNVINLMDALRRSVGKESGGKSETRGSSSSSRRSSAKKKSAKAPRKKSARKKAAA